MDYEQKEGFKDALGDSDLVSGMEASGLEDRLPKISKVLYAIEGAGDESSWHWLLSLWDGGFAYVTGGCCYTGWDCQGGVDWHDADSLNEAVLLAPEEARRVFDEMIERREHIRRNTGGI